LTDYDQQPVQFNYWTFSQDKMSILKFVICLWLGIPLIYNNSNDVLVAGFSLVPRPLTKNPLRTINSVGIMVLAKPEFSMADASGVDEDDDEAEIKMANDAVVTTTAEGGVVTITATEIRYKKPQEEPVENEPSLSSHSQQHPPQQAIPKVTPNPPEYGALAPGTVVQVQIGDLSLARKAWKKRRRTGSPLLVPCSILTVDRNSMVRWNLIHLLEKFGSAQSDGIAMTVGELSHQYKIFLKSSLMVRFSCVSPYYVFRVAALVVVVVMVEGIVRSFVLLGTRYG
jgi:hypothetical protein